MMVNLKLYVGRTIFYIRWRYILIVRYFYIWYMIFKTSLYPNRAIRMNFDVSVENGRVKSEFGNFAMVLTLQRLWSSLGRYAKIVINNHSVEKIDKLEELIYNLEDLLNEFESPAPVRSEHTFKKTTRWIDIHKRPSRFLPRGTNYEHILIPFIYRLSVRISASKLRTIPFQVYSQGLSGVNSSIRVGWAYRINSHYPQRNSKPENVVTILHKLTSLSNFVEIVFLGSEESIQEVTAIVSLHRASACPCVNSSNIAFQRENGFNGAVNELKRVDLFFADTGHGLCDFVLNSDLPFVIFDNFSRYHPTKVKKGFPWRRADQLIYPSLEEFLNDNIPITFHKFA